MSSFLTEPTQTSNEKLKLQEDNKIKNNNAKTSNKQEETKIYFIKGSFMITYVLLLTTGLITFIEAIRTQNPLVRHILNLETCISLVAGYFYGIFVGQLDQFEKDHKPINWDSITKTRYVDWAITTPIMLLVLVLVFI
jgi:bacteriorhodopsin